MKRRSDPARLTDPNSNAQPELVAAIQTLRSWKGSAEEVEAIARRLAPQLAAPTYGGAAAAPSAFSHALRWLIGGCLALGLGLGAIALDRHEPRAAPAVATSQPVPNPLPNPTPRPADPEPLGPPPVHEPAAPPPVEPQQPERKPKRARAAARRVAVRAVESELVLLERAHAALARDAADALAHVKRHAHYYPRGVFAQERELLGIEALLALDRTEAAIRRARAFLRTHPESLHAVRVRAVLARLTPAAPPERAEPGALPRTP